MTSSAPGPADPLPLLRALLLGAGVALLVAALVLLVVSHQPSASSVSAGHLHGSAGGVVHAAPEHAAPIPGDGAAHTHESPAEDHDHGTLVVCTLLAAAALLALVALRAHAVTSPAQDARAAGRRLVGALVATTRSVAPPDLLALGISRT